MEREKSYSTSVKARDEKKLQQRSEENKFRSHGRADGKNSENVIKSAHTTSPAPSGMEKNCIIPTNTIALFSPAMNLCGALATVFPPLMIQLFMIESRSSPEYGFV
jgi:hypothetical protein